jgi:Xaa-Pro aminopeptidase
MLDRQIYINRRNSLREKMTNGILLFPGNGESAMNYPSNTYHYRQDSSFLYFFGIDIPGLTGIIDMDSGKDILFGDDFGIDDIIWMGEQPSIKELAYKSGIEHTADLRELSFMVKTTLKESRKIHILPPYRGDHLINLGGLFDIHPVEVKEHISEELIRAVVSLREIKDEHEIQQIEQAVDTCYKMHTRVMEMAFPGTWEREIAGQIEGISLSHGNPVSFPVILSMDGQTLHNHYHGNLLKEGRLIVTDAGAESPLHYAGDITRNCRWSTNRSS